MRNEGDRGADRPSHARGHPGEPIAFGGMAPRQLAALGLIVLFAAGMRFYAFGARPLLWGDELGLWEYVLTGNAYWMPQEAPLYGWLQLGWLWWIHEPTPAAMRILSDWLRNAGRAGCLPSGAPRRRRRRGAPRCTAALCFTDGARTFTRSTPLHPTHPLLLLDALLLHLRVGSQHGEALACVRSRADGLPADSSTDNANVFGSGGRCGRRRRPRAPPPS